MNKVFLSAVALSSILTFVAGCDHADPHAHNITPPDKPADTKVPTTKEEKIAAINKAPISEDQKKAAIAKVNAGS